MKDVLPLLEAHQDAVYGICLRVLRHPQDAEDACQEALVEAARHARSVLDPRSFGPWLRKVALTTALDLRRKRERRRLREAKAPVPGAPVADSGEDLHRAIAELDDDTRWVVLEHYYAGRPLREIASEAGVSEAAIWKRLEKGREQLRTRLAPAVLAALGAGGAALAAPEGLARKAVATVPGGVVMKKVLMAALVLIPPALVGSAALRVRPEPPRAPTAVAKAPEPAASTEAVAAAREPAPAAAPQDAAPASAPAPKRRPWPLELPPPGWPDPVKRAWEALMRRVTIDLQNVTLSEMLAEVERQIRHPLVLDAEASKEILSFKVREIVGDGALRLALGPRGAGYEIREDGTIFIARLERLDPGLRVRWDTQGPAAAARELERVRRDLDAGVKHAHRIAAEGLKVRVSPPQGERSLEEALQQLGASAQVPVVLDSALHRRKLEATRVLGVSEEAPLEEHLRRLAAPHGLVPAALPEGAVLLTTPERAQELQRDERWTSILRLDAGLDAPLGWAGAVDVPQLVERLERSLGVQVITSKEAWDTTSPLTVLEGETGRAFLDRLGAWGFRWTSHQGTLFLLK